MNTNTNNQTCAVYSMRIAAQLQNRGHKVIGTLPNPKKPEYDMWIFEVDSTFDADLKELRRKE